MIGEIDISVQIIKDSYNTYCDDKKLQLEVGEKFISIKINDSDRIIRVYKDNLLRAINV